MHVSQSLPSKKNTRKTQKNLKASVRKSQSSEKKLKTIEHNTLLSFNQLKLTKNFINQHSSALKLTHLTKTQPPKADKKNKKIQFSYNVTRKETWALFDLKLNKFVAGQQQNRQIQMKMLSKLLVFATTMSIVMEDTIDTLTFQVIVTDLNTENDHKSIQLYLGDRCSLQHFLYLLLISDIQISQQIIATNLGAYLSQKKQKKSQSIFSMNPQKIKQTYIKFFEEAASDLCKQLKLKDTNFDLSQRQLCKTSVSDLSMLAAKCFEFPLMRKIMKTEHKIICRKFINENGEPGRNQLLIENSCFRFQPQITTKCWKYGTQGSHMFIIMASKQNLFSFVISGSQENSLNQTVNKKIQTHLKQTITSALPKARLFTEQAAEQIQKTIRKRQLETQVHRTNKNDKKFDSPLSRLPSLQTRQTKQTVFKPTQDDSSISHSKSLIQMHTLTAQQQRNFSKTETLNIKKQEQRKRIYTEFPSELQTIIEEKIRTRRKSKSKRR